MFYFLTLGCMFSLLPPNLWKFHILQTWSTPLHLCAQAGHLEVVEQLKTLGWKFENRQWSLESFLKALKQTFATLMGNCTATICTISIFSIQKSQKVGNIIPISRWMRVVSLLFVSILNFISNFISEIDSLDESIGGNCFQQQSGSNVTKLHNYSFHSFRKPFTRAVHGLLHRK